MEYLAKTVSSEPVYTSYELSCWNRFFVIARHYNNDTNVGRLQTYNKLLYIGQVRVGGYGGR